MNKKQSFRKRDTIPFLGTVISFWAGILFLLFLPDAWPANLVGALLFPFGILVTWLVWECWREFIGLKAKKEDK